MKIMPMTKLVVIVFVLTSFSNKPFLVAQSSDELLNNFVPFSTFYNADTVQYSEKSFLKTDERVSVLTGKNPGSALLRSFVLPGWGHYYIDNNNWNRGRVHLLSDVILIGSYFGIRLNANKLESNLYSFAKQHAGVDIRGKGRKYLLNIAEYPSIQVYNDFQERSRNWDQIYTITPENDWLWNSEENRLSFLKLDNKIQNSRQQLPAIISLMVVNRIVSGISAFSRATQHNNSHIFTSFTISNPEYMDGNRVQFNVIVSF
jgi:hypothetical protein